MADLSRKRDRERLKPRREPYWQRLAEGTYLGFRCGPDTWVARFRGRDGKQQYKAIGEALEYDDAKRAAEAWLAQLAGAAVRRPRRGTVREALEAYLADLRRRGRELAAADAEVRFKRTVYEATLGGLVLERVTRDDLLEWRDGLRPGRKPRTVNREARSVAAALNQALKLGHIGNPSAWKFEALSDDIEEEGATAVFLSAPQRAGLIAAAPPAAAAFFRGLELTGARPKELAGARVADLSGDTLRLAHRKGKPPKLRTRYAVLSIDGAEFFASQARDKLPAALIFTEDGSQGWRRHRWAAEMRRAIIEHNKKARGKDRVTPGTGAYSFRHTRISELLQVHGIDPLTVAAQTGTSLVMIEKAYLKFIPGAMREKLAAVKA